MGGVVTAHSASGKAALVAERAAIQPAKGGARALPSGKKRKKEREAMSVKVRDQGQPTPIGSIRVSGLRRAPQQSIAMRRELARLMRDAPTEDTRTRAAATFNDHFGHLYARDGEAVS
jgi:hypothetical protein